MEEIRMWGKGANLERDGTDLWCKQGIKMQLSRIHWRLWGWKYMERRGLSCAFGSAWCRAGTLRDGRRKTAVHLRVRRCFWTSQWSPPRSGSAGVCEERAQMTSGFDFKDSSDVEGRRERGVHETLKESWRGRRRGRSVCLQKDSCIWNESSESLTVRAARLYVV